MRTILIVEDDTVLSGVLHTAFRREWNVELASNADEALQTFREAAPDIVLTDKNMPGMNGLELLHAIRRIDPAVGMVVMTAYGTVESASDSFDVGVDAYVEKPFPDLIAFVREMAELAEHVVARRQRTRTAHVGALRIFAGCSDAARREMLSTDFDPNDTVRSFASLAELERAVKEGGCDLTVVDCTSLDADPARVAPALDAEHVPCIIIAEGLSVPEITRLIDLAVKALVNAPIDDPRFGEMLRHAIARIRRG